MAGFIFLSKIERHLIYKSEGKNKEKHTVISAS